MSVDKCVSLSKALHPLFELTATISGLYVLSLAYLLYEKNYLSQGSARQSIESVWRWFYEDVFHESKPAMAIVGVNAWGFILYWGMGGIYIILDLLKPKWITQYSVQPNKEEPLSLSVLYKIVKRVVLNQVIVGFGVGIVMYQIGIYTGMTYKPEEIPSLETFFYHFVVFLMIEEIGFYYSHRLFHEIAYLYKNFHKLHTVGSIFRS
eukprot:CFRG5300T1